MSLLKRFRKEETKIEKAVEDIDKELKKELKPGFFSKKSKLIELLKKKSSAVLLKFLIILMASTNVFAIPPNVHKRCEELMRLIKAKQITQEAAALNLGGILIELDKYIEEDIAAKNYSKSLKQLSFYMAMADTLEDNELYDKVKIAYDKVKNSLIANIDTSKTGIYTDKDKSAIYIVGKIELSELERFSKMPKGGDHMTSARDYVNEGFDVTYDSKKSSYTFLGEYEFSEDTQWTTVHENSIDILRKVIRKKRDPRIVKMAHKYLLSYWQEKADKKQLPASVTVQFLDVELQKTDVLIVDDSINPARFVIEIRVIFSKKSRKDISPLINNMLEKENSFLPFK